MQTLKNVTVRFDTYTGSWTIFTLIETRLEERTSILIDNSNSRGRERERQTQYRKRVRKTTREGERKREREFWPVFAPIFTTINNDV